MVFIGEPFEGLTTSGNVSGGPFVPKIMSKNEATFTVVFVSVVPSVITGGHVIVSENLYFFCGFNASAGMAKTTSLDTVLLS